jgi:hypothetical protein
MGKDFPSGKGRKGTWISVGPSHALYPATIFRSSFSYVPARYMSGGRATALAIDPNCSPGHCRIWIFAAGGGIWRTKNALTGQPSWEFLSGDFGIQSGSSITLDPNDSTGETLVGTGSRFIVRLCGGRRAFQVDRRRDDGRARLAALCQSRDWQHRGGAGWSEHDLRGYDARRTRRHLRERRRGQPHSGCRGMGL